MIQNWKQPKYTSDSEWMSKFWYINSLKNYPARKGTNYSTRNSIGKSFKTEYVEWKKAVRKGCILFDFIYETF